MPTVEQQVSPFSIPINVRFTYPYSDKYDYFTWMELINLDKQREEDIKTGKGFIIESSRNIKDDVKNQRGIFSNRYGSTISDIDSFNGKYRCRCGMTKGSIMHGERCPVCGTLVKFYDDDVSITGWLVLKPRYFVIHPNLYQVLAGFIGGPKLARILKPDVQVDSNGKVIRIGDPTTKKDEPFRGIGMLNFIDRYQEILDFYLKKFPLKKIYYDHLMKYRHITFTHSIPVYSALLRPSQLDAGSLKYEVTNENFMMLSRLVYECNKDNRRMDQKIKAKLSLLDDIQFQFNKVYNEIIAIMSKKKGDIRAALGGRYSFSARSVIAQDTSLKPNEIRLPFHALVELLQQPIINILTRTLSISYAKAYKRWYRAQITGNDQLIYRIIEGLIQDQGGLPVLINRNPTIAFGGILACRCVGINMNYTMSVSLLILKILGADFDGDSLNILYMYNQEFIRMAEEIFSPCQMFISRNDGMCNGDMLPSRDIIINANALKSIGSYTPEEVEDIKRCMAAA